MKNPPRPGRPLPIAWTEEHWSVELRIRPDEIQSIPAQERISGQSRERLRLAYSIWRCAGVHESIRAGR